MSALLVGYARCSTDQQALTAQRDALLSLGVASDRIYVNHGLTGTKQARPGLREALAAWRAGDRWWQPSSTGSLGRSRTLGRSPRSSPYERPASRWVAPSTTVLARWGG